VTGPLVVLIHGFTANGDYLHDMATYCEGHGLISAIFQYDSYVGIDDAAEKLVQRLGAVAASVTKTGFSLVGHSMGGLVARTAAVELTPNLRTALKSVVTLGTPNQGTLSHRLVGHMLDWAENVAGPNPFARAVACRSSQQLTRTDSGRFIDELSRRERGRGEFPMLSVSGGLAYLECGKAGGVRSRLQNLLIQAALGEDNDGLVTERSADLRNAFPSSEAVEHLSDYSEHSKTNHTYLVRNQEVATRVIGWMRAHGLETQAFSQLS